jgi:hypothetical protein
MCIIWPLWHFQKLCENSHKRIMSINNTSSWLGGAKHIARRNSSWSVFSNNRNLNEWICLLTSNWMIRRAFRAYSFGTSAPTCHLHVASFKIFVNIFNSKCIVHKLRYDTVTLWKSVITTFGVCDYRRGMDRILDLLMTTCINHFALHNTDHWHTETSLLSLLQSPPSISWHQILAQEL